MQDLTPSEPLHPVAQRLAAPASGLERFPPPARWDDWEEYDAQGLAGARSSGSSS